MSKVRVEPPQVIHTPKFTEYQIEGTTLYKLVVNDLNLKLPLGMLDKTYYYTDSEGWAKILFDMVFKSTLYKNDRFDCDNYALKAMTVCAERYGLNSMGMVIGNNPQGRHAFNIFYLGDGFLYFEPNEGYSFSGEPFEIGEHGYQPELVIL